MGGAGAYYNVLNTTGANGSFPSVQTQSRTDLGWTFSDFAFDWYVNFTSAYRNWNGSSVNPITYDANNNPAGGGDHVSANITHDFHIAYNFQTMFGDDEVSLSARNAFNSRPPFYNSSGGWDTWVASPLGPRRDGGPESEAVTGQAANSRAAEVPPSSPQEGGTFFNAAAWGEILSHFQPQGRGFPFPQKALWSGAHGKIHPSRRRRGAAQHDQCRYRHDHSQAISENHSPHGPGQGAVRRAALQSRRQREAGLRAQQAGWRKAKILVAGENFGCGSSRSMPPGRCSISASAVSSPPASPTSSMAIASRTAFCRSHCPRIRSTS